MFFYSRVLPAARAVPTPGDDIVGAIWRQHMRRGEIALFNFDAKSGQILKPQGEVPALPMQEVCMIFGSRHAARVHARAIVQLKPHMVCALYDRRGRWLATFSAEGERQRHPELAMGWRLLQFPLMAFYGTLGILALSPLLDRYYGIGPIRWWAMSSQERVKLIAIGFVLGAVGRMIFEWARMRLVIWHGKPAVAPIGSPEREKLYRRIAKNKSSGLLVPLEVTFNASAAEWPSPEKHAEWAGFLQSRGFQSLGQYSVPETKAVYDFWFDSEQALTALVVAIPTKGLWLGIFTRYEDGSSFSVLNKDSEGLDQPPGRTVVFLGPNATAEKVWEHALHERPEGDKRCPTAKNVLEDYKTSWRTRVQWRRDRGTTAEEVKRVSERRAKEAAAGSQSSQ